MSKTSKVVVPKTVRSPGKGRVASGRLKLHDYAVIEELARAQGVGVCTFTRFILEQYINDHAPELRKKAIKRVGRFRKTVAA